ncbi:MAG: DNA primase [Sphingomonadaceae bacterium]
MAGGVVDQIRARVDVVDVISEKVTLKKAGKSLKGLCPFHVEKTPSFIVFPETGTWHCFGCGAGGDLFTFVMRSENVQFGEALALLAARAGVELQPGRRESRADEGLEKLYAINGAAAAYFASMLESPAGSRVRDYLQGRGFSPEGVRLFRIGFAPDAGAGLAHHLLQQGFGRSDLLLAGVVGENESGGLYDRFRNRLMFPIADASGKLVGFGGRALSPEGHPKYLNTPQTPLFDKGSCLYAIDLARREIRQTGQAVIVEGYADAVIAHQYGFRNVVAALGTSITDRQLALLKPWSSELCFALDPDEAGQEATVRGLTVAMESLERSATPVPGWKGLVDYVYKLKTAIKIITLPHGRDPDEVIREDPARWRRLVQEAVPVEDFFLERVRHRHDLSSAPGKAAAVEEAMSVIGRIPEPVQQAHYVQKLAAMVGIDEGILLQQVRPRPRRRPTERVAPVQCEGTGSEADVEGYCLALILSDPSSIELQPELGERHFADPGYREIFRRIREWWRAERGDLDADGLIRRLRGELEGPLRESLEQLLEMGSRLPTEEEDRRREDYKAAAITLMLTSLELRRKQIESVSASQEADTDPSEFAALEKAQYEIIAESHRLKLLGDFKPLRAIHKEVRHGG